MSEGDAIHFYGKQVVAFARTLPVSEMIEFLRGALAVAGSNDSVEPIREAYIKLAAGDAQLELIASGQLKLPLGGNGQ
jgi:hypothetical protein